MTRRVDPLERLADLINEDKKVVIITGAGLSAASGVPVFRGGDDAIWVQRATSLGTKSAFLRDTIRWYNTFWFPFFRHEYTRFRPNDGHEGIARLANLSPHILVVTQNIDSLHQQTRTSWSTADQLIEVHGRLGLYHCSSEHGCELATETFARAHEVFPPHIHRLIEEGSGNEAEIIELPLCPQCLSSPIMPLALMFDEDYTSHAFYQFDRAMDSFESADALVFVGTSFSVNITSLALSQARQRCIPVFNINLKDALNGTGRRYEVFNVMGPSEEKLKQLADLAEVKARLRGGSSSAADVSVSAVAGEGDIGGSNSSRMIVGGKDEEGEGEVGSQEQQQQLFSSPPPPQHREDVKEIHLATTSTTTMAYELDPAQPSHPLSQEQVDVAMHFRYARKVYPDPQMEASIHHIWTELQTKNFSLFNGSKFRLAKCEMLLLQDDDVAGGIGEHDDDSRSPFDGESSKRTNGTPSSQQQRLILHLWLTDYKTFRGTNWHPSVATLVHDGLRDFQDPHAYLSQKLGVNAAVCTSDGFVVLIRRSQAVAEGQGLLDVPGGHPEPQHLGLPPPPSNITAASTIPPLPTPSTLPSNQVPHPTTTTTTAATTPPLPSLTLPSNQDIVNEIFHSVAQEVVDEINIPMENLRSAQLLGIVRQRNSAGCPSIAFLIPCTCTRAEVLEYYQAGPKEADESTELVWVRRDQIATIPSQNLTPSAQGCLDLLNQLVPLSST